MAGISTGSDADAMAVKQVVQAMAEFRDQDEHAHALGDRMQGGRHAEPLDDRRQHKLRLFAAHAVPRGERDAHEEVAALHVAELGAVGDIAAMLGEQARDGGDNSRLIGARQGEDEGGLPMRHATGLCSGGRL